MDLLLGNLLGWAQSVIGFSVVPAPRYQSSTARQQTAVKHLSLCFLPAFRLGANVHVDWEKKYDRMSLKVGQCRHAASAWINNDLCSLLQNFLSINTEETYMFTDSFYFSNGSRSVTNVNRAFGECSTELRRPYSVNTNSHAQQIFQLVNWKSRIDRRATLSEVTLHGDGAAIKACKSSCPRTNCVLSPGMKSGSLKVGRQEAGRHPLGWLDVRGIRNKVKVTCI